MSKFCVLVVLTTLLQATSMAKADIVWFYESTDGVTSVTGQLTTTGNAGDDQVVNNVFSTISIDTLFINGVNFPAVVLDPLPFTIGPNGDIIVTSAGNAVIINTDNAVSALGSLVNFEAIRLARPGSGVTTFIDGGLANFNPTSTTFSTSAPAVPEPSSLLCMSLLGVGAFFRRRGQVPS